MCDDHMYDTFMSQQEVQYNSCYSYRSHLYVRLLKSLDSYSSTWESQTFSHLPNCKVFFSVKRSGVVWRSLYISCIWSFHILPMKQVGVDSKSSVCIVIGWVGGRNVLMHKYSKHWNYNLMVCGIREGSSCSLHSRSLFNSAPHPSLLSALYHSLSFNFILLMFSIFHNALNSRCLFISVFVVV